MSDLPAYEKLGIFYLGRKYDLKQKKALSEQILFPSKNLVTHGLIVGMTGSGKTGLCFDIIEEAAIDSIPAIVIDPKGDLSNMLLTFPDLKPDDFKPWVNEEDAKKAGVTLDEFAAQQAEMWKKGLADWDQDAARIKRLRDAADFTIYTPGSNAGMPVSILKSFERPPEEVMEDAELLRDLLGTTVSGLLQLVGIDADPVKSKETVLLANLIQHAWTNGRNLDLAGLIAEVQNPSVERVGVFDIDTFYPAKQRFELAMQLNNLLASPGFAAWMEGESLDVGKFLHTPAGKPRVAIFSIAHLGDAERMFFVTMLLNQMVAWMRQQSGTSSLRALLYMDEIFGYFPPVANPPSKQPLLTLLKQARAFGVGVVLATQNPVDLDYKGLANIGTWFIGRLQTDRDKARIMDGLEGATSHVGGRFDRAATEQLLAALGNRVFLHHSVHDDAHVLFQSRWAMSYLRGPMSRQQIKQVMAAQKEAAPAAVAAPAAKAGAAAARPVLPPEVPQFFAAARKTGDIVFVPRVVGFAQVRFTDRKLKLDENKECAALAPVTDDAIAVDWNQAEEATFTLDDLSKESDGTAFTACPRSAGQAKNYSKWGKDFTVWVYGNQRLRLFKSPLLGETSLPEENERAFRIRMQQMARELRDAEVEKLKSRYGARLTSQHDRVRRAAAAVDREESQATAAKSGLLTSIGTAIASIFISRSKVSVGSIERAATAGRGYSRVALQSGDVERAKAALEAEKQKFVDQEAELQREIDGLSAQYDPGTEKLEEYEVKPTKTNITVRLVGLVWIPFVKDANGVLTPAYSALVPAG